MSVSTSALLLGFVTALRFAALPTFVVLGVFSLAWKKKKGVMIALWKLGAVLLGVTLLATVLFATSWSDAVGRGP